jgi:hypothetical protein
MFLFPHLRDTTMSAGRVSWSHGPADSAVARAFCYLQIGVLGGMALVFAGAVAGLYALTILSGNYRLLALLVLLTLVGGPASLLYLLPLIADPDQRPPIPEEWAEFRRLNIVGAAVAAVLGAVVIIGAFAAGPPVLWAAFLALPFVAFAGRSLASDGAFDPRAGTLTYADREVDLDDVTGVNRTDVAGYAVVRLAHDAGLGTPGLLVLPESVADAVVPALDRAAESADPAESGSLALTATLVAFGLGSLAGAAGLASLAGSVDQPAMLYWAALVAGLFGGLFLWVAWRE